MDSFWNLPKLHVRRIHVSPCSNDNFSGGEGGLFLKSKQLTYQCCVIYTKIYIH